jgi:hypothetical protein
MALAAACKFNSVGLVVPIPTICFFPKMDIVCESYGDLNFFPNMQKSQSQQLEALLLTSTVHQHDVTEDVMMMSVLRFGYLGKWSPCVYEPLNTSGKYFVLCTMYFMSNFTLT